ncbi:MAG: universal stress protein [Desulfonauticus sp.]|nr:universal stress protein [Desulfonauticus sp.]
MVTMKKILCAVDFSDISPKVAEYAKTLAQAFDGDVVALYVAPALTQYVGFHIPAGSIESFVGEIVSGAEKTMDVFVEENFENITAKGVVCTGDAAEEIVNFAQKEGVDIIVMGTHGRKGIDRLLFGSVAEKVVKTSKIPVLTVRPD